MIAQNRWWVLLCRDAGEALSPNFYLSHMKIAAPRAKNDHRGQMWSEAEACRKRWECHVFQRMLKGEVAPEKCVTWTLTPLPVRASSCCRSPSLVLYFLFPFHLFCSHTHPRACSHTKTEDKCKAKREVFHYFAQCYSNSWIKTIFEKTTSTYWPLISFKHRHVAAFLFLNHRMKAVKYLFSGENTWL